MSASFPGENLSLARSDSQGPPLSQHVLGIVQALCQAVYHLQFCRNTISLRDLLVSARDCQVGESWRKTNRLRVFAAATCGASV